MSPLSRTVAHAITSYASQEGLTMDALREAAPQHAGNLRAELMQTTGNTQLFTNDLVSELLGNLKGEKPSLDVIDKLVGEVISRHETRMAEVNTGMGATLQASQSMGTGQRAMGGSPLMTQIAAQAGTLNVPSSSSGSSSAGASASNTAGANADPMLAEMVYPNDQSGATIGMQGASWGKKFIKKIRTGAIVMALSAAAMTGFMGYQHLQNTPDFDQNRPAIELIQKDQAQTPSTNITVPSGTSGTTSDGSFGAGAGQVEHNKEAAHQQMLRDGAVQNPSGQTGTTAPTPNVGNGNQDAGQKLPDANAKEATHNATFGATRTSTNADHGSTAGAGNVGDTEGEPVSPQAQSNTGNTGSDEGVRSFTRSNK